MGEVNTQTWDMILSLLGHLVLGDANSNDQNLKDKVTLLLWSILLLQWLGCKRWIPNILHQIRISKTNTNNSEPLLCLHRIRMPKWNVYQPVINEWQGRVIPHMENQLQWWWNQGPPPSAAKYADKVFLWSSWKKQRKAIGKRNCGWVEDRVLGTWSMHWIWQMQAEKGSPTGK